ncbi:hypothetical protein EMCRGX_G022485 [Ephydatia muelleri]
MASLLTEIPDVLDMREIWLTNMLLLGFDPITCEEKYKIPFTRDMFVHINKKGMEVAMHFLFSKLDSHVTYEEFRDCWPVYDKKQEQQFRKTCANWLAKIAKDDPMSKLPRIAAPLLLSPGGDKFQQFMLRFSAYVLKVVCLREARSDGEKQVFVSSFLTSSEGIQPAMKDVSVEAIKTHIVRHTGRITDRLQLAASLHDEWRKYASHLTSEYRATSKENRELTHRLEGLKEQRASFNRTLDNAAAASLTSPEAEAVKRRARIAKVREMWRNVEEFELRTSRQREEVEAILEQKGAKQTIAAKEIAFQISDLIFQNYERDIREGKIANTYQSGKLSLSGLIQVWNCALSILKDHLCDGELPSFEDENVYVGDTLQAHRGHSAVIQTLRVQLELRAKQTSPVLPPVSVPALGLLPPSPPRPFTSPDKTLMEQLAPLSPPPVNGDSVPYTPRVALSEVKVNDPLVATVTRKKKSVADKGSKRHTSAKTPGVSSLRGKGAQEEEEVLLYSPLVGSSGRKFQHGMHMPCPIDSISEAADKEGVVAAVDVMKNDRTTVLQPHDLLAEQIAAEVATGTAHDLSSSTPPGTELHSFLDPLAALGREAFVSKDKVPRTPSTKNVHNLMQQPRPDAVSTPVGVAGTGKIPEAAGVSVVEGMPSLTPSANGKDSWKEASVLNHSVSTHHTPLNTMDTSLLAQTPEPTVASPDLTAQPSGSLQQASAKTPHQSRILAFESPIPLLPSSPSSPVVVAAGMGSGPSAVVNTSGVLTSPPPLARSASTPQLHVSSTPFLPLSRLTHTARQPGPQDSSGKTPPQSPVSHLQPLMGASLPPASVTSTPPLPPLTEPSSVAWSADSDIRQGRLTFNKGKAEVSKLDIDLLDFSSSPRPASPSTAPISAQENLLEFSPQNLLSYIPDQRAAMENSDVMGHGMFDSDGGSSVLASLSTNSSQCSQTEMPE